MVGAALGGAVIAYLLDPSRGRARRARMLDQGAGVMRRAGRETERAVRAGGATLSGKIEAVRHGNGGAENLDDATLAQKAETELFRDPSIPKGAINLNVEHGVLVLRGEVPSAEMRERLASEGERIKGIWSVQNLLHLPGEPAPEELARTAS
jgi:hypothetical protein